MRNILHVKRWRMVFELKEPLLGFETITHMELKKIDDIFMHLKNAKDEEPSFTLINPFVLRDYVFDLPEPLQHKLEIDDTSNLLVFNIVIIRKPIEESTVNFTAPLIFNTNTQFMAQHIISDTPEYGVAESIKTFMETNNDG